MRTTHGGWGPPVVSDRVRAPPPMRKAEKLGTSLAVSVPAEGAVGRQPDDARGIAGHSLRRAIGLRPRHTRRIAAGAAFASQQEARHRNPPAGLTEAPPRRRITTCRC